MSDNKKYWNEFYYSKSKNIKNCSNFCSFIINYFKNIKNINNILDAGCGNGRDSFVLSKYYNVIGVDNCGFVPNISEDLKENKLKFLTDNFITIDKNNFDLIYSRFTFHSITNEEHQIFLNTIKPETYLAIEARSIKGIEDSVYYGKNHYRNYIDLDYLKNILIKNNFEILLIKEDINMAKYKDENPICIRVICKKK